MSLLEVKNLHTYFKTKKGIVKAVNDVTYSLDAGKTLGIVGESGSGKSVSAMSIIKLLDGNGYIESGEITFDGKDIRNCTEKEMYHIRGNEISVIFQEPMTSLNPVFTVERQIGETLQIHQNMSKKEARAKAVGLLADVKIPNPERVAKQYPFQLSGGMRQRVMIAMALACKPKLLIADEPTPGLDAQAAGRLLGHFRELAQEGAAVLFITHDLELALTVAHRVAVFYAGETIEEALASDFEAGSLRHPFTQALWDALPQRGFRPIPGSQPYPGEVGEGCPFLGQCPHPGAGCAQGPLPLRPFQGGAVRCLYPNKEVAP